MSRKPFTGGELNILNGKAGISAPNKSVPVARLVRYHRPKSASELEKLISDHVNSNCKCGIISKGTIKDFGKNLYDAQIEFWGEHKYSLQECIQWEFDLFILQMLKGDKMEDKCKIELQKLMGSSFSIKDTHSYIDEEQRVDLEVFHKENLIAGIQVKPNSYKNIRKNVLEFNENANKNFEKPVFYIYYNYDKESFLNINEIIDSLNELIF